jgi:hypothetical protein
MLTVGVVFVWGALFTDVLEGVDGEVFGVVCTGGDGGGAFVEVVVVEVDEEE